MKSISRRRHGVMSDKIPVADIHYYSDNLNSKLTTDDSVWKLRR